MSLQLNLPQTSILFAAMYMPHQIDVGTLSPALKYNDYVMLMKANELSIQDEAPRFQYHQIDSSAVNMRAVTESNLDAEFESLVKQWKDETFFHSSLTKIFSHPAYVRIMAMGMAGLPLVLRELQKNNGRWFYALKFMAGKDISEGMKNAEDARAAWLEWGYKNNYI